MKKILFFDTETTGLPDQYKASHEAVDNWPRVVQCAFSIYHEDGTLIEQNSHMILPPDGGFEIDPKALETHGKTNEMLFASGKDLAQVMATLVNKMWDADIIVAHNYNFDDPIIRCEIFRVSSDRSHWIDLDGNHSELRMPPTKDDKTVICTMLKMQKTFGRWPKLSALHHWLFGSYFDNAHDAGGDVAATAACFFECVNRGFIKID